MARQHSYGHLPVGVFNSNKFGQEAIYLRVEPVELDGQTSYGSKKGEEIYEMLLKGQEFNANAQLQFRKNERGEIEVVITNLEV